MKKNNKFGAASTKVGKQKSKVSAKQPRPSGRQVVANYAQSTVTTTTGPKPLHVSHKEMVGVVAGNSGAFMLLGASGVFPGYDINPGNALLFPWLSTIAMGYEKYRFSSLKFRLIPRNSAATAGAVYGAIDYDWDDTPASSAAEMLTNVGAVTSPVWSDSCVVVDCQRLNSDIQWRYVSDHSRVASDRFSYAGFYMVGIAGTAIEVSFDLMVEYCIDFMLPCTPSGPTPVSINLDNAVTISPGGHVGLPVLPAVPGLDLVTLGTGQIPSCGLPVGTKAYRFPSRGTVGVQVEPATTGDAPTIYASDTSLEVRGYNSAGAYLSQVVNTVAQLAGNPHPAETIDGGWLTPGARAVTSSVFDAQKWRELYHLATYIVPVITSIAGRVLNTDTRVKVYRTDL